MYRDDRVWVANAGDSRAVLGTEIKESSAEGGGSGAEAPGLVSIRDSPLVSFVWWLGGRSGAELTSSPPHVFKRWQLLYLTTTTRIGPESWSGLNPVAGL